GRQSSQSDLGESRPDGRVSAAASRTRQAFARSEGAERLQQPDAAADGPTKVSGPAADSDPSVLCALRTAQSLLWHRQRLRAAAAPVYQPRRAVLIAHRLRVFRPNIAFS